MSKAQVVFVVGGPGAGKGTQCEKLVNTLKCAWFSTGDLLRDYVKFKKGPDAEELGQIMAKGQLVSSERLVNVLKVSIETSPNKHVLLDGFPRSQENIDAWDKVMPSVAEVVGVLYFEATDEEMTKRLLGRNQGRADDNIETIKKRLEVFKNQSQPVINKYEKAGKLMKVNAMRDVESIFKDVLSNFKANKVFE